jgi:hypothetical protein
MTEREPLYITYADAAKELRLKSTRTISRYVASGLLEARGSGRGRRIVYASLKAFPNGMSRQEAQHG